MYNRRLFTFAAFIGLCSLVVVFRLGQLQLVRGGAYAAEASKAMRRARVLQTKRGDIVDRLGRTLAMDHACFEFRMEYPALLASWVARHPGRLAERETGLSLPEASRRVDELITRGKGRQVLNEWLAKSAHREGISRQQAETVVPARVESTLDRAAGIAGVSRHEVDENINRIVRTVLTWRRVVGSPVEEEYLPHAVIGMLDEPTAVAIRAELGRMPAASVGPSTRRWYPYYDLACHIIGLLGKVRPEDCGLVWRTVPSDEGGHVWKKVPARDRQADPNGEDLLHEYRPDELAGMTGAEKLCERLLRGVRGRRVKLRTGELLAYVPPRLGGKVRLSLDIELQERLTDLMRFVYDEENLPVAPRTENGAAVVLDVDTGEVLAMVSTPTYDLNTYRKDYRSLVADEVDLPLLNRAVAGRYPPGSTVKPLTGLAAVAEGVVALDTPLDCRGYLHTPNKFRCWIWRLQNTGHGPLTLQDAIKKSCNIYFYKAGEKLRAERLLYWMRQFGLGARPGTGLPEEKPGRTPTAEWLWQSRARTFSVGDARQMAIGQGLLEATPLQIANAMATLARDGEYVSPKLVMDDRHPQVRRRLKLPAAALRAVQRGMFEVVNVDGGTAYKHARHPSIEICGKTGTATMWPLRIDGRIVKQGDLAWFAGYAPSQRPRIAFAVVLAYISEGGGGSNCGPLARKLVTVCEEMGYLR